MSSTITGKRQLKVFLSHAYSDLFPARKIRNLFVGRGFKVYFHDNPGFGENWLSQLRSEIETCDAFVPLITPESAGDSQLLQETGAAWGLSKPIVPIVTRRDLLNQFPIAIARHVALQPSDLDNSGPAERFLHEFEGALAAAHAQ